MDYNRARANVLKNVSMVTFFLLNPEREVSTIAILVSFNGKKYRRSIHESIPVNLWNNDKKRVRVSAKYQQGNIINDTLSKWEVAALRTLSHFKEYYNAPSKDEFFEVLDREFYKDEVGEPTQKEMLFLDYLQIYIDRYDKVRDPKTIQKYVTARNKLAEYEKQCRKKLKFKDINIDFYNDFQSWFYSMQYANNYFGSVVKVVKQAYKEARFVDKLHGFEDIGHKDFVTVSAESDNVYLDESELNAIYRLEITQERIKTEYPNLTSGQVRRKYESLLVVRDRFLIGAYTGLRVSDFSRIGEMNIDENYIRITTDKGKSSVIIQLHPIVKEITSRFDPNISVSDQKLNKHIKEIARLAGITKKVLLNKHIGGKVSQLYIEKCDAISTHTARRSFATNAYKAGVPTIAIMKVTGHKKESNFMKYIKVSAEENAEMLKSHPFFIGKSDAEPNAEPKVYE